MASVLESVAEDVKAGRHVEPVTVRTFLSWFGAKRRGPNIVRRIRHELDEFGIITSPDFESRWVDANIDFILKPDISDTKENILSSSNEEISESIINWTTRDAAYKISKLAAANQHVIMINPDQNLSEAITLLLSRDFSQLPVATNERDVKGIISWKSIGSKLALSKTTRVVDDFLLTKVRDFMTNHHEIRSDVSIFDAIPIIVRNDYILIRGDQNKISGIVTASDLSNQFRTLSEPFLLISEIENFIRNMIGKSIHIVELQNFLTESEHILDVDDLTFGDYIRVLQNKSLWQKLNINIDRVIFCDDLDKIREIRNDVTHFDPDGITDEELEKLRDFKLFLQNLEQLTGG